MSDAIETRFNDKVALTRVLREAVRQALERHAKLGESVAVWRDGKVQVIPASEALRGRREG